MSFLTKKLKSFFRRKENDIESFFNLVNAEEWSDFIGQDEIRMIRGVF
ncbi:uncharacterized protein METZ01_LOCUS236511, partial [marine metagenome]